METDQPRQSLSELFGELTRELRVMIVDEISLARSEMSQKISGAMKDAVYVGIGALLLLTGLLALTATFVIILSYGLPWWLAALIVTIVVAGLGYLFLQKGISDLKSRRFAPDQTIETLKEGGEWLKSRIS